MIRANNRLHRPVQLILHLLLESFCLHGFPCKGGELILTPHAVAVLKLTSECHTGTECMHLIVR